MKIEKLTLENDDFRGDDHVGSSAQTPLRTDAFDLDDDQKIELIKEKVGEILHTLGMDLTDDSLKGTPKRVAKCLSKRSLVGFIQTTNPKRLPLTTSINTGKF